MNQDSTQLGPVIYAFGNFRVDEAKRLVYSEDGEILPLKPKAFETLLHLVKHAGKVVERDEILSAIWPDTIVEENNLTQHISSLRRILGEKPDEHRYIATIPGHGYKFVAKVTEQGLDVDNSVSQDPNTNDRVRHRQKLGPKFAIFTSVIAVIAYGAFYFFISGTEPTDVPRSIAILPFKPLVAGQSDESFEMGMAETLISKLANNEELIVRPLTAVRRFNLPEHDSIEAGRVLGVDAVLDGSIQKVDDRVRISAKLLRVADSKQLWSGQFDERLTDIFVVQDSISERVAAALEVRLGQQAKHRYTKNAEAYQLYVRGRYHAFKLTPTETLKGLDYFQKAIDIDPNYALAYAGISDAYRSLGLASEYPPKENFEKSIAAAQKAIEIDSRLAEGYTTLAMARFWYTRDWAASEAAFKTALDLDQSSVITHLYYAHLLSNTGRHAEAATEAEKARRLDPVSPFVSTLEGLYMLQADRPEEAFRQFAKASEIDPNFWMPHLFASRAFIELNRFKDAKISARKATELAPAQSISVAYESYAAARLGERAEATALLTTLLQRADEKYVPPYHIAIAYLGLGDRVNALAWLEKGVAENDPKVTFLKVERVWDEIRSEERFVDLVRRMKLE